MSGLQRDLQFSTHGHGHRQLVQFESSENPNYDFLVSPSSVHLTHASEFPQASFGAPTLYTFSASSSPSHTESPDSTPSPDSESSPAPSLPELYSRKPATRLRSGNRVPRPRNAFMIFRSEFWAGDKISSSVERDHRHISRIIGHCWNQLSETEKDVWRRKAEQEKVEHSLRYPGYRFSPTTRKKKPVKRKVKRNGKEELLRCKQVAALILSGKEGEELDTAVKCLNVPETQSEADVCNKEEAEKVPVLAPVSNVVQSEPRPQYWNVSSDQEAPAFRSPLLPPAIPAEEFSSARHIEVGSFSTSFQSQYNTVGGYTQYSHGHTSSYPEPQVHGHEYYIVNTAQPGVARPRTSVAHISAHSTYPQLQNQEMPSTVDAEYSPHSLPALVPHITFRNPFEFPSAFLPYVNQPRSPLDPLQWDFTGFAT